MGDKFRTFCNKLRTSVSKIARESGVWVQSFQPPEVNWGLDLEAEPPELGEFLQIV